jgi:hypothetical protein
MLFKFSVEQIDFLTFQLFTVSKSDTVLRTRRRGQLLTSIAGLLLSINLFVTGSTIAGFVMLAVAVATYLFYPRYHRWRLKSHFLKYSKKNYGSQFGQEESLETKIDHIISKNIAGEGKVKSTELESLTEIADYYFLKMKNGSSIILPKRDIKEEKELVKELKKMGVPLIQELEWAY